MSQPSPLAPARQRAQELLSSGDLGGAQALLERAVELGKVNLAEDDPDVLLTALQLGRAFRQGGDPSAARRVLEESYAAGQWRLGDHDPLMVEISAEIGGVAEELGNRHEARKAFTRVAEHGPAALGANHQAVAQARAYLGGGSGSPGDKAPAPASQPPAPQAPASFPPASLPPASTPSFGVPATPPAHTTDPRPANIAPPPRQVEESTTRFGTVPAPRPSQEESTTRFGTIPTPQPSQEEATSVFGAVPGIQPPAGSGQQAEGASVAPPPQTAPVWTPPDQADAGVNEPTAVHPVVTPREPVIPQQRPGADPAQISGPPGFGTAQTPGYGQQAPGYGEQAAGYGEQAAGYGEQAAGYGEIVPRFGEPPAQGYAFGGTPTPTYGTQAPPGWGSPAYPNVQLIEAGAGQGGGRDSYGKKGLGLFAAIAAILAAVIAVVALVFVVANRPNDDSGKTASNVPTLAGEPPTGLRLKDEGSEIQVSWTDPTQGTVSFIVVMGHPGESLQAVGKFGPGQTSYRARGLNPNLQYCFAVVAVYATNRMATSPQSCTNRTPAPSAT